MLLDYLKNNDQFTDAELAIKNFIITSPAELLKMTIRELAKECHVSIATVNRFCKKLGFEGFSDFKVTYVKEYPSVEKKIFFEKNEFFTLESNLDDIMTQLPYIYEKAFNYGKIALDRSIIQNSFNLMKDSKILVYGTGLNKSLADIFQYKVREFGIECSVSDSLHYQEIEAQIFKKEKMFAILISHTGENRSILSVARKLNEYNIPCLLISNNVEGSISKYCNYKLEILPTFSTMELSNTHYMMATQYILDIYVTLFLINNIEVVEYVSNRTTKEV